MPHLRWSMSSLSQVEGWHAPAGRRTWEPRSLARPGRSDRQRRWVPREPGPGRHVESEDNQRRQPISRSGRDPGHRPYAQTKPKLRKQGRSTYPHPPCRIRARACREAGEKDSAQNVRICARAAAPCSNCCHRRRRSRRRERHRSHPTGTAAGQHRQPVQCVDEPQQVRRAETASISRSARGGQGPAAPAATCTETAGRSADGGTARPVRDASGRATGRQAHHHSVAQLPGNPAPHRSSSCGRGLPTPPGPGPWDGCPDHSWPGT
jgi:hypothetical protein